MPIYSNALTQRPANMLAYEGGISATPRNEYLGALADLLAQSYAPQRTQQMQGVSRFLSLPAVSETLDRLSYGEPLTTGAGMTTRPRAEAAEAAMAVAPLAKPATMASLQAARAARQAALATRGLPVGMSTEAVGGMGFLRPAPQEEALRLAQQRAALPVEQGGLDLAANNTAEQRAAAMGFESGWAHGSPNPDITNLKPSITGAQGEGIYATNYLPEANMYSGSKEGATNYPLYVKTKSALNVGEENPYDVLGFDLQGQLFQRQKDAIISKQKETEDWLIKNGVPMMPSREHYVSTLPENFRSRFAAFDPWRKTAAIAASLGVAAPDLLAAEKNKLRPAR